VTPLIFSQFGFGTLNFNDYISLIAAATNAFNGALLARRPDHYRNFTVIGVVILAYAGGIGGGVVRDVLINKIPTAFANPWFLIVCLAAAVLALLIEYNSEQKFKDGLFQFMTAFSLPWYAIVGAQAALHAHLGYFAAVIIGMVATTAGRWIIDTACLVIPKQLVRGEFFMTAAALSGIVYVVCDGALGLSPVVATILAFIAGFGFRLLSQYFGWEEWEPWEPQGVSQAEKARKTLGEGLHAEFDPKNGA
jgi:uncharacterized membrane protein YeiH